MNMVWFLYFIYYTFIALLRRWHEGKTIGIGITLTRSRTWCFRVCTGNYVLIQCAVVSWLCTLVFCGRTAFTENSASKIKNSLCKVLQFTISRANSGHYYFHFDSFQPIRLAKQHKKYAFIGAKGSSLFISHLKPYLLRFFSSLPVPSDQFNFL